jgi:mono/diheme cytochrome c family protein
MRPLVRTLVLAMIATVGVAQTASAIPAFARKYRVSCQQCHAPVPRLNAFGEAFAANGFEFAVGEPPRDTLATGDALLRLQNDIPLAVRYDAYLRAQNKPTNGQNSIDLQTPWVIKLLSGGQVADKVSYYMYFLLSERGEVAGLEDAYIQFTDVVGSGVSVILGQFQVSDPLFKRELRLEYEDYQAYRVRVGLAAADLTYDRGAMALWSPREGTDVALQVVAGRGLNQASGNRQYDPDDAKSTMVRLSQDIGVFRVGAFAYRGYETESGARNTISMWGPDATMPLGSFGELNASFVRRVDRDPFFGTCSVGNPCPGNETSPFGTTVNSGFAEVLLWPQGPTGRLFFTALYNWVDSDRPVVSLRLGEQDEGFGYLSTYSTASTGVHYLYKRNIRLMGVWGWDLEREQMRLVLGTMLAF